MTQQFIRRAVLAGAAAIMFVGAEPWPTNVYADSPRPPRARGPQKASQPLVFDNCHPTIVLAAASQVEVEADGPPRGTKAPAADSPSEIDNRRRIGSTHRVSSRRCFAYPATEQHVIDLPTALQLAETANPTIAFGRQAIVEAVASANRGSWSAAADAECRLELSPSSSCRLQSSFGQIRNLTEQTIYGGGRSRRLCRHVNRRHSRSHASSAIWETLSSPPLAGQPKSSVHALSMQRRSTTKRC